MFIRISGAFHRFLFVAVLVNTISLFLIYYHSPLALTTFAKDLYANSNGRIQHFIHGSDIAANDEAFQRIKAFWVSLEEAMRSVRPMIDPIVTMRRHKEQSFEKAWPHIIHEDLITLLPPDLKRLKTSHSTMLSHIDALAPSLPYTRHARGIVTTAGESYINILLVSLRMLRRSGSKLPVEVFLDSRTPASLHACSKLLPALGAKCIVFSDFFAATPELSPLRSYQLKIFALLFSSFQDILFLDADAFPACDPDHLLRNEPFASAGLVTWPDFWSTSTSPMFWEIAGMPEPREDVRASTESGVILVDKAKHAKTLLLVAYYNYFGPDCFYPLLAQGAQGEGDKETFLPAAMALNATYYAVKASVRVVGAWVDGEWVSSGMKQADPVEDFQKNSAMTVNATAKEFFVHHNNIKLDAKSIFEHPMLKDGERRLWGPKESAIKDYGNDLEKEMWEELTIVACSLGSDACERANHRYKAVYAK